MRKPQDSSSAARCAQSSTSDKISNFTKLVDTRWFTDDEMNKLFQYYFSDKDGVRLVVGIDVYQHDGEILRQNLEDIQFQQASEESFAGLTQNMIIAPINLGNQHWSALYLYFNSDNRMEPTIGYFDPFGGVIPSILKTVLLGVFSSLNERNILICPIKLQKDGYNCGPWVVAILKNLVGSQGLHLPSENFDIQAEKLQYRIVLGSLLSLPAGEFVSSFPPNSNFFRKRKGGSVNQNVSGNHVKGNLNLVSNFVKQNFQVSYPKPVKKSLFLKCFEEGRSVKWRLPRQDHLFIERKKLWDDLELSLHPFSGPSPGKRREKIKDFSIHALVLGACAGMGGVGKTQLALQYVHHTTYPYTIKVWFKGENIDELKQQIIDFARDFGFEGDKPNTEAAMDYLKLWLKENPGWLLVFDNIQKYEDIAPFLPESGGTLLITTRSIDWPSNIRILKVDVMEIDEAIELVKKLSGRSDTEIKALVEVLGYLPLALAQASAYIKVKGKSVADYLELYQKYELKLLADRAFPKGAYHLPVAATWDASLVAIDKELEENNFPPLARTLMTVSAYLASDNISTDFLLNWFQEVYPQIEAIELVIDELLNCLNRYSLITLDSTNKILSIHRLMQSVLRHQHQSSKLETSFSLEWFNKLLEVAHKTFNNKLPILESSNRERYFLSHLQILLEYYDKFFVFEQNSIELGSILEDIGNISFYLGRYKQAESYYERALKIFESLYKQKHPRMASVLKGLSITNYSMGDYEKAKKLLMYALIILTNAYGENDITIGVTLGNLAVIYGELGNYGQAKRLLTYALKKKEEYYGNDDVEVAVTLVNLGAANGKLRNYKTQKDLLERALLIFRKFYKEDHIQIARTFVNLAAAYGGLGDTLKQQDLLKKALKIEENHYGRDHVEVAKVQFNLALTYMNSNEHSLAFPLLQRSYTSFFRFYGEQSLYTKELLDILRYYSSLSSGFLSIISLKKQQNTSLLTQLRFDRSETLSWTEMRSYYHSCLSVYDYCVPKSDELFVKFGSMPHYLMFEINTSRLSNRNNVFTLISNEAFKNSNEQPMIFKNEEKVGPRYILEFHLKDFKNDEDRCFYQAISDQLILIDHIFMSQVPYGIEVHNRLKLIVQGPAVHNRDLVKDSMIDEVVRYFDDLIFAIIDTNISEAGFTCYYVKGNNIIMNCEETSLPNKPIIRIASTGDHFMSVRSHPNLAKGSIRQAYNNFQLPFSQEQRSLTWMRNLAADEHFRQWKKKYNEECPDAEKNGYGPGTMVLYKK